MLKIHGSFGATAFSVVLVAIMPALACAPQAPEVAEEAAVEVAQIEEIPITTDSDAARALYEEAGLAPPRPPPLTHP